MSNIFKSKNLDVDFLKFEKDVLKTNFIKFKVTPDLKSSLKRYHRLTYSVSLICHKIESEYTSKHYKYAFLSEVTSDLLVNISLCFQGFLHTSHLLIRRIIENFYNHIFFFDHPIEYIHLNEGKNDYTPIVELKQYLEKHPNLKEISVSDKNITQFNTNILNCYHELCRTVHTKGVEFMGLAKNLGEIKQDFSFKEHLDSINKELTGILYILYKFHKDLSFTHTETDLIVKSFTKDQRTKLLE